MMCHKARGNPASDQLPADISTSLKSKPDKPLYSLYEKMTILARVRELKESQARGETAHEHLEELYIQEYALGDKRADPVQGHRDWVNWP